MMRQPSELRLENRHTGEVLVLRRLRRSGTEVLELRGSLPPHREGPPLHVHYVEDEDARVISGRLSADVGGQRVNIGPGELARLPRGVPHRWWNDGDGVLELKGFMGPVVDFDRCVQAVFEVMNAGAPNRPSLFYLAHLALRHRRTQATLIMPPVVQAVLFRVVVAIGTLLGRYRGTEWPGCPARCTGAPYVDVGTDGEALTA
jgi:mannose-6-phosphate isomerase-like protein (cupin superfamily)